MRRTISIIVALFALTMLPALTIAQDASPAAGESSASACAAPVDANAPAASPTPVVNDDAALAAIALLPLDRLDAVVSRADGAEKGELTLGLPGALAAIKLSAQVQSDSSGPIGTVDKIGDELVFRFDEVTYEVAEIILPIGGKIDGQKIRLDPDQPSTMCVDLTTGKITRNFHWLMTGTNVLYDGSATLALGDRGKATVADIKKVDEDHYAIHLLTHWQSEFELTTWSLNGTTLPSGKVLASAEFEGTYTIDFSP